MKEELKKISGLQFDAPTHTYTESGRKLISVTTFITEFHEKFDEVYHAKRIAKKTNRTVDEVLKEWHDKGEYANDEIGTPTHLWIENHFNNIPQELPENSELLDRIDKFNVIDKTHLSKLVPIVFEQRIYSKKYPLAGTIDSIFGYKDMYIIIDWKTNKKFTHDDHKDGRYRKLYEPFTDLYSNHHNEYSIQIALYILILREWGINIKTGYLCHIGPNSEAKMWKIKDIVDKLDEFLKKYDFKKLLEKNEILRPNDEAQGFDS